MATVLPPRSLDGSSQPAKVPWFTLDDDKAGPAMVETAKAIWTSQEERRAQMLRQARLFSNSWLTSLYDLGAPRKDRRIGPWNVCAAAVSTAQSMVCRSPVKVTLETSDAPYTTQRLSRDATRWLYGVWDKNKVGTEIGPACFFDAGVVDVGAAVVRVHGKEMTIERVFPDELAVSDVEVALYGKPYQIFIRRWFPRHEVIKRYGEDPVKAAAIEAAREALPMTGHSWQGDMIPVWEGWSLDGKHILAVPTATLEVETWPYDFLPVVPLVIDRQGAGYYGRGYVQQLMGYQIQLLQINDAIDEHIRLMAAAKWSIENGSGIDPDELDNEIGGVIERNKGFASPELLAPDVVPKDLLEERRQLYETALNEVGLNTWAVQGKEPADRSGVAMEVARDKEQGRLSTAGSNYEQWHVDLAYVCLRLGHKTAGKEYVGRGPEDKELKPVDFKRLSGFLKERPWRVRPFPIGSLPESPDAKRKTIEGWLETGLVTGPVALSLLELPDVDAEASLISAAREDILWSIEQILEKGREGYRPPEPLQDLELGKRMFMAAYLKGRRQEVEEAKLDLLDQWIREAEALQKPVAPVVAEQRPGVGTAPAQVVPQDPAQAAAQAGALVAPLDAGAPAAAPAAAPVVEEPAALPVEPAPAPV